MDDTTAITKNKTVLITKHVENRKPFVASFILFVSVSVILAGIVVYFHVNLRQKYVLPYLNYLKKKKIVCSKLGLKKS